MTNKKVREKLFECLWAFLRQNCQYNDSEPKSVSELLTSLYPVDDECEKFNKKHKKERINSNSKIIAEVERIINEWNTKEYVPKKPIE